MISLLPHKLTELIIEKGLFILLAFFTSEQPKRYNLWSYQRVCDALHYLLDNMFIFCSKLYSQIVGIPMGTNCVPLAALL